MISQLIKLAVNGRQALRNGRPQGILTIDEIRSTDGVEWTATTPANNARPAEPKNLGTIEVPLHEMALAMPELGILNFSSGRAVAKGGFCFTKYGSIIRETTWHNERLFLNILPKSFPNSQYLEGTCLALISEFSAFNFGHYVLDSLSRLEIARLAGFSSDKIDYFYLNRPSSDTGRLLLDKLEIDQKKCIWADDVPSIIAKSLLVTSFPGTKRNYSPIVPEGLRRPFESHKPTPDRKIFVPRRGTRRLVNEVEIETIAKEAGLEIYDFRNIENECEFFRSVGLVVGPHGSDLANIAFCQQSTKVLELIPSDHVHPYFYTIATGAGLDYHFLVGRSEQDRPDQQVGPSPYDFHVDPHEFRQALIKLNEAVT